MDERKPHTREFQLKDIDRIQNLADALSLKYIKLVIPKILFILVLCRFNFSFKLCDPLPLNITTLPTNNITPHSKIKISDPPPPNKYFCEFFTSPSFAQVLRRVHALSNNNGLYQKMLFRSNGLFWARKWHILITLDRL